MLVVLLIWCYIFVTGFHLGIACKSRLELQVKDVVSTVFIGLFCVTILSGIWAIFGRINWEFHLFLLVLNTGVFIAKQSQIKQTYIDFFRQLRLLSTNNKVFLVFVTLLIAWITATPYYFPDNEIYYIQTIKWINEYGFVKGLANLHLYFGQTSGWHILQSAFNFSFTGFGSNCLNGFCLLIANLFATLNAATFKPARLFALVNLLMFPFIAVPSPDLAVCVLSFVLFFHFITHFENIDSKKFNLIFILAVFIVFVKIIALPILLLPLVLFILHFKKLVEKITLSYVCGFLIWILFIVKNTILTGYPLFPSAIFNNIFQLDYALPQTIYDFSFNRQRRFDFFVSKAEYFHLSELQLLWKWLFYSGWKSIFNCVILFLVITIPFGKSFARRSYRLIYFIMLLQLLFIFAVSPQYRFMLHFVVFFGLLLCCDLGYPKIILSSQFIAIALLLFLSCFHFQKTINQDHYHSIKMGNLTYFSPDSKTYIWATGNGNLPCVNKKQLQYLRRKLGYIPQLRSKNLKDGFYSVKVNRHDP